MAAVSIAASPPPFSRLTQSWEEEHLSTTGIFEVQHQTSPNWRNEEVRAKFKWWFGTWWHKISCIHLRYSQLVVLRGSGFAVQCGSCKCKGNPETLHQTNKSHQIAMKISTAITLHPSCIMAKGYPDIGLSSRAPEMNPWQSLTCCIHDRTAAGLSRPL